MNTHKPQVIVTVRHGEQLKTNTADDDTSLTEKGRRQVEQTGTVLCKLFGELAITRVLFASSTSHRALETAIILSQQIDMPRHILVDHDLRERELGRLDPRQMRTDPRFKGSKQSALYWVPEEGESLDELCKGRLLRGVTKAHKTLAAQATNTDRSALVFTTHGGFNHASLHHFTGMSDQQLTHGPLVAESPLRPLQDPGYIVYGQAHIYTPQLDPESQYHNVRTMGAIDLVGVNTSFDSGPINVLRS